MIYETLNNPEKLNIIGADNETHYGGSQEWFAEHWRKQAGCGAIAASNLIWYMRGEHNGKEQYIELMNEMFSDVKPGIFGVNSPVIFTKGIKRYGARHDISFTVRILDIPLRKQKRPGTDAVNAFIMSALHSDAPVAFLNLTKGMLKNLGSWHWVTITAFDTKTMQAKISDYGKIVFIDINLWLKSSALGGAFVYLQGDIW